VSNKTGWEGRDQQRGARIGIVWTLSRALGPAANNIYALEFPRGYIVFGCWELKRKFRVKVLTRLTYGTEHAAFADRGKKEGTDLP
jgi:hypothetical protein